MKIAELSRRSDVSVATIKYYLRDHLLAPGVLTSPNQADYDENHVRRLRLIRVLVDVGGLSLGAVREVLAAVDDDGLAPIDLMGVAHHALVPHHDPDTDERLDAAFNDVVGLVDRLGWHVTDGAPSMMVVARALLALQDLCGVESVEVLEGYARTADEMAAVEIAFTPFDGPRDEAVEYLVVGTVVYEAAFNALRRLAQEHHTHQRLGPSKHPRARKLTR
jgi:DNA-binding transcriptional MerR regulator